MHARRGCLILLSAGLGNIITHCGGGGRGAKSQKVLQGMGYTNVHNGSSADAIRAAIGR
jgi:rhodanese-related sulfurtransferase